MTITTRPQDALTAANRLIFDDGIKYIVGPLGSAPALAVLPLTTENKAITMTMAFTPKALSPDLPFSFRPVIPTDVFTRSADPVGGQRNVSIKRVGAAVPQRRVGSADRGRGRQGV